MEAGAKRKRPACLSGRVAADAAGAFDHRSVGPAGPTA